MRRGHPRRATAAAAILLGVWLGLPARPVRALDPGQPIAAYAQRVWSARDGLPATKIKSIAQGSDGYLWVATDAGLVRFDGISFTVFDVATTPALGANQIGVVFTDRDGQLWIGTDTGTGVLRHRAGTFEQLGTLGMPAAGFISAHQDRAGRHWFGTWWGVARYEAGRASAFPSVGDQSLRHTYGIAEDGAGVLWLGTSQGLVRFGDGHAEVIGTEAPGTPEPAVRAVAVDREGAVWAGTDGRGLVRYRDGAWRRFTVADGLAHDQVRALHQDRDGNLWIGTQAGLSRFRDGRIDSFANRDGPAADQVWAIAEDREGSLWLGARGGLVQLRASPFHVLPLPERSGGASPTAVLEGRDGSLWIGTDGAGLLRYRGGAFSAIGSRERLCTDFVFALAEAPDGDLWVGGERGTAGNLCRIRAADGAVISLGEAHGLPARPIRALGFERDGTLLVGAGERVFRRRGERFEPLVYPDPDDVQFLTRVIFADRQGDLWIGTEPGLRHLRGDLWKKYTRADGLPHASVVAIVADEDGTFWLGTKRGLARYRNGRFTAYSAAQGLVDDPIYQVLDDGRALWLCTPQGMVEVVKADLEAHDRGARPAVGFQRHVVEHGTRTYQCHIFGGASPNGMRGRDGRLHFPIAIGVASIDPARARRNELPPPVVIERVVADGRALGGGGGERAWTAPPGRGEVQISYAATSLVAPEKVRFQYRLEPFDTDWVEGGGRRTAYYTNLPPGPYRFRVRASNNDGVWNLEGASIGFRLEPHFHQTAAFGYSIAAALVLLGLGVGGAVHLWRLRQVRAAHAAVLAERGRMARELHDTLAQGFTGISVQLEAAVMRLASSPDEARVNIDQARSLVRESLAEARRAVWGLRLQALEHEDLVSALRAVARSLGAGIPVRLQVNGAPRPLAPEQESALLRVGQEAAANAIKHAHASRVAIEVSFLADAVELTVTDDGRGFDPDARFVESGHFGLAGMRERIEALGGTLTVSSRDGGGTAVSARVPAARGRARGADA